MLAALAAPRPARPQGARDGSRLVGNWAGESVCVNKENRPACRDEQVVYRIAEPPDEAGKVTISADKLVDGKPELMYVLDFKYDAAEGKLVGEFNVRGTRGVWEYRVEGDSMEGALFILPDRVLVRRVKVKKERPAPARDETSGRRVS